MRMRPLVNEQTPPALHTIHANRHQFRHTHLVQAAGRGRERRRQVRPVHQITRHSVAPAEAPLPGGAAGHVLVEAAGGMRWWAREGGASRRAVRACRRRMRAHAAGGNRTQAAFMEQAVVGKRLRGAQVVDAVVEQRAVGVVDPAAGRRDVEAGAVRRGGGNRRGGGRRALLRGRGPREPRAAVRRAPAAAAGVVLSPLAREPAGVCAAR